MRVVDAPKHPQVLFVGFQGDEPAVEAMSARAAGARVVEADDLAGLRLAEWDVLVARGEAAAAAVLAVPGTTFILAYGGAHTGYLSSSDEETKAVSLAYRAEQRSPELHVSAGLSTKLAKLVAADLVPWLQARDVKHYLGTYSRVGGQDWYTPSPTDGLAFVQDADGNVYAGLFQHELFSGEAQAGQTLVIPHEPDHPESWLDAAMDGWAEIAPDRFRDRPMWWTSSVWQTLEERLVTCAEVQLDADEAYALASFAERRLDLNVQRLAAEAAALNGRRDCSLRPETRWLRPSPRFSKVLDSALSMRMPRPQRGHPRWKTFASPTRAIPSGRTSRR